ncbi:MAG: glycoside hydrolase family 32 protein [Candidatus Halalkalibacterium sp. M3_1C_030]
MLNPFSLKTALILIVSAFWLVSCNGNEKGPEDAKSQVTFKEEYRPQYHFSPAKNWMNDPNGLVYHKGEYHLFYQYNPFGITWGHMSWGHAVSNDMMHWQHLPVALKEENGIMIFSGSAVVDHMNSTGFGSSENPPLIAIYTGHQDDGETVRQDQRIAYSVDNGRSWTKYAGNPVIDEGMSDFRDPKVFRHEESGKWIMVVALSKEQKVRFYGSDNLKDWNLLSEFGPAGASNDILWECPDLFKLNVDGNPKESRWVLQVDVNPGSVAGGSGGQYFVGEFDGERFTEDPGMEGRTNWVDYGRDFYAAQSYSDIPEKDGRRIWLAWMSNWDYAQNVPTDPWRSAMSLPREVELKSVDIGYRLIQKPVSELRNLRKDSIRIEDKVIKSISEDGMIDFNGKAYELLVEFDAGDAERFGLKVRKGEDEETIIGYDVNNNRLFVDRTRSGNIDFDSTFPGVEEAPLEIKNNRLRMHVFVDWSSVEVFADGGEVVITDRIFPSSESGGLEVFSEGGTAKVISMDVWNLESVWKNSKY